MPLVLNCGENHPWTRRYQTDRRGFKWIAETVRQFPDIDSVVIVERKMIDGRSYVVIDHTTQGFGNNFEPKGDEDGCPKCGGKAKLRILSYAF